MADPVPLCGAVRAGWFRVAELWTLAEGQKKRMILTFTVECAFGAYFKGECIRAIEIDEEACLYDLHEAIQDSVSFGRGVKYPRVVKTIGPNPEQYPNYEE